MATVSTRVDVRERRSFSVGGKRRIVGAYRAAVASGEGGGVVLRREGIYQSLVFKWGRQIDDGTLGTRRRGPAATGKDPAKIRVREYGIGVHSSSPMVANRFVDRGVHLDGDREPNVGFAAGGGDRTRVKPRIGTQRQRPGRPGGAGPVERLGQEPGSASPGVGVAVPQPGMHNITGAGDGGDQRVIATHLGVGELRPALLGQPVRLNDRRVDINRHRCVAGAARPPPMPARAAHRRPCPTGGHGPR